ncbi:MAG TPA: carboxypeptidase-like regulatory domain-containing protein [Edaphocola sp.]|nr:carboxypeptidase-like regulatory domain-containing protein [Edaphocola sp.]
MYSNLKAILFILLFCCTTIFSFGQNDKLVQVTGVVKLADTSDVIPYMGIFIKNTNVGTLSSEKGLFSLLAQKGDTLVFSRLGFAPRELIIPKDWSRNFYTTTQYFEQDTFMLNEVIVQGNMTPEEFDYAMKFKEYNPDINAAIKEHTSKNVITMMMRNMSHANGEGAALIQRQTSYQNSYYGQQAPQGLFNPFKWAEFYKALQRGDFRKKK